ncbi:hypothetical protein, partial [Rhodonellum psychrophilum]
VGLSVGVCFFEGGHFEDEVFFSFKIHHLAFQDFFQGFSGDRYPDDGKILYFTAFSDIGFSNLYCLAVLNLMMPENWGKKLAINDKGIKKKSWMASFRKALFFVRGKRTLG